MNKFVRDFLDRLLERLVASVASVVASTFSTYRAAEQAQQQSRLEDLARQYEDEGKTALAQQLRAQAAAFTMDDPAQEARAVIDNVLDDAGRARPTVAPPAVASQSQLPGKAARKKSRRATRASRRETRDNIDISLDP